MAWTPVQSGGPRDVAGVNSCFQLSGKLTVKPAPTVYANVITTSVAIPDYISPRPSSVTSLRVTTDWWGRCCSQPAIC